MRQLLLRVRLNGRRVRHSVRLLLFLHYVRGSSLETYGRHVARLLANIAHDPGTLWAIGLHVFR